MKTAKTFDCVDMKHAIQRALMSEYEARKSEFDSFSAFIAASAEESPHVRQWKARVAQANAPKAGGPHSH
jgi:hypothetical protein